MLFGKVKPNRIGTPANNHHIIETERQSFVENIPKTNLNLLFFIKFSRCLLTWRNIFAFSLECWIKLWARILFFCFTLSNYLLERKEIPTDMNEKSFTWNFSIYSVISLFILCAFSLFFLNLFLILLSWYY